MHQKIHAESKDATTQLLYDRPAEAAALSISLRKLDALFARGEITPTRIDGRVLIALTELIRFVEMKTMKQEAVPV